MSFDIVIENGIVITLNKENEIIFNGAVGIKESSIAAVGKTNEIDKAGAAKVDTNAPHLTPCYNPKSLLVYSATGADVSMVLVAGRIVVQDKKLLTFDVKAAMARVAEIAERIARKNEPENKH
jgi:5-methylthioadenosine/S-adenosylhomocysteine deaminase